MFSDRRLSDSGKIACASCHDVQTNGAGGGSGNDAHEPSTHPFNTLTVFNAALSFRLNWEGNFRALDNHVESSLQNSMNMRTSVGEVVARLRADPEMVQQFRDAYGRAPDRASFLDALTTFERSLLTPGALEVIAFTGAITALLGASIAVAQNDIKRILAFSTVSQLGYMMLAVGVGAWTAAILHLLTHAFFKALLFLGAGSVIHAAHHEQEF